MNEKRTYGTFENWWNNHQDVIPGYCFKDDMKTLQNEYILEYVDSVKQIFKWCWEDGQKNP